MTLSHTRPQQPQQLLSQRQEEGVVAEAVEEEGLVAEAVSLGQSSN